MESFEKQPSEKYPIAFEYYGKLPLGVSLVEGEASAYNVTDSISAPEVLQTTNAVIDGTQAKIGIQDGADGKTYRITCRVILSDDSELEDEVEMVVKEL